MSTVNAASCCTLLPMRVLGIDCGTEYTGYGVVELSASGELLCLLCGAIKLSPSEPLPLRLSRIFDRLNEIIQEHHPDYVAIEDIFYAVSSGRSAAWPCWLQPPPD